MLEADMTTPRKATAREWMGLAVIALPCMLYSMDLTVLNLALPRIAEELRPSAAQLLWIVDIYGFLLAGALVTMGTLGDRIGRRRLLMIGAAVFGVASVLAALADTAETLIAARALLGLAAATLAPSTLSLISNMFPDDAERRFAIGIWIASFSAGAAVGPVLGGLMLTWFWWGSVFLLAVPVMALLLLLAPRLLPEHRDPDAGRIDLPSAALSLVAMLALVYGLKAAAEGRFAVETAVSVAVGLGLGAAFVLRQRRLAEPLVDLAIFGNRAFSAALAICLMGFFVAFGSFMLVALHLQLVLGLAPMQAGLWSLASAGCFVLASVLTPRLAEHAPPRALMAGGFVLAAAAFFVMSGLLWELDLAVLVTGACLLSLGLAPVFTLATDVVLSAAPPERAGVAAGLSETSSELGGALGIAVLGSVVTAVFRLRMQEGGPAASEALDAAGGNPAGVLALSAGVDDGAVVDGAARIAFEAGFSLAALLCSGVCLLAAVATILMIAPRQIATGEAPHAAPQP
jgi:DHA2 family multidrug resistance protein-like MFS transporter